MSCSGNDTLGPRVATALASVLLHRPARATVSQRPHRCLFQTGVALSCRSWKRSKASLNDAGARRRAKVSTDTTTATGLPFRVSSTGVPAEARSTSSLSWVWASARGTRWITLGFYRGRAQERRLGQRRQPAYPGLLNHIENCRMSDLDNCRLKPCDLLKSSACGIFEAQGGTAMMLSVALLLVADVVTDEEPVHFPPVECCLPSGCFQLEQVACWALMEEHRAYLNQEARARTQDAPPPDSGGPVV
jgi:hypothetical protein